MKTIKATATKIETAFREPNGVLLLLNILGEGWNDSSYANDEADSVWNEEHDVLVWVLGGNKFSAIKNFSRGSHNGEDLCGEVNLDELIKVINEYINKPDTPRLRAGTFDLSGESYQGFTLDQTWNGFSCPYFTREVTKKILSDLHDAAPEHYRRFREGDDWISMGSEDGEYTFTAEQIGGKELFNLGGFWTWIEDTDEDEK